MDEEPITILNSRSDEVDPRTIVLHPRNPRRGNTARLVERYRQNGFYGRVIVDEGSTNYVLAGNHRVKAAIEAGMAMIPVEYVRSRSEEHALAILLSDNRESDEATNDDEVLAALLLEASQNGVLAATGYDEDYLDELLREPDWQTGEGGPGLDWKSAGVVRPVIQVLDTRIVEEALRKTGEINRAEAFMVICRTYLGDD